MFAASRKNFGNLFFSQKIHVTKFCYFENSNNVVYVGTQDALLIEIVSSKKQATTVNRTSSFEISYNGEIIFYNCHVYFSCECI